MHNLIVVEADSSGVTVETLHIIILSLKITDESFDLSVCVTFSPTLRFAHGFADLITETTDEQATPAPLAHP